MEVRSRARLNQTGVSTGASRGVREVREVRDAASVQALGLAPLGGKDTPAARDLRTFNKMVRGELAVDQGLMAIAYSGGWPVQTANGFLFAQPANGMEMCSISGEHTDWKPVPMQRAGDLFWIHMPARADVPSKYKIVDQKGNYSPDSWSRSFAYDNNGEYSLTKPVEGARFERWPRMTDGVVEPRAVRVFVPEDRTTHHLYVHDGQTLFDPTGPHGGWKLDQSAGSRTLVIGIDNTPARREEYTHSRDKVRGEDVGGGAPKYAKFVEETLRPFIQKQYGAPKKVGVMGASLGGLVSYYQAVAYPHAYDFVAGLSATMRWGKIGAENPTMADLFRDRPKTKTVFYLDSGGEPNGRDNYNSNRATADALAGLGYRWDEQLYHWHEPGAEHTEKAWADRVHGPLQIFEHLK